MADSVLLIDHYVDELRTLGDYFDGIGYAVERAGAAEAGLEAFDRVRPDVVILDQEGAVILLTDLGDIATGARAMQLGAEHFVTRPVDLNHLAAVTARVCDKVRLMRQNALLREALDQLLSTPRPGKAREIWKAVEHLPADLRKGGGGGDGSGGGGGRRHQPQRRFGSTAGTARARPRSSAFRARR